MTSTFHDSKRERDANTVGTPYADRESEAATVTRAVEEARWLANLAYANFSRQAIGTAALQRPSDILGEMAYYHRRSGSWIVGATQTFRDAYDAEINRQGTVLDQRAESVFRELLRLIPREMRDANGR